MTTMPKKPIPSVELLFDADGNLDVDAGHLGIGIFAGQHAAGHVKVKGHASQTTSGKVTTGDIHFVRIEVD
jgi:hypothetical protein